MPGTEIIRRPADSRNRTYLSFDVRPEPASVLMCAPDHFDVIDVKNPHMKGQVGKIDRQKAERQWKGIREAVVAAGGLIRLIEPGKELEDMVFTANPVLPGLGPRGEKICLLSNMTHASRKKEVPLHEAWFSSRGYKIFRLSNPDWRFEGQGDALWHPGRKLLWGGHGFRSVPEAYEEIGRVFDTPVAIVRLIDEAFYHLDTCLCPISQDEAIYFPDAFDDDGRQLIKALFPYTFEVPMDEARAGFACNALVLGKNVLIQRGNLKTNDALRARGYQVIELDTSEYIKSGGSIFCMKMMVY